MRLENQIPVLSLKLGNKRGRRQEIYPLIVKVIMQSCKNFTAQDAGSSGVEDFLSSAVLRVLMAHKRYNDTTELTTFMFKHIKGAYKDLMRKEMNYATRFILTTTGDVHANRPEPAHHAPEIQAIEDRQEFEYRIKVVRNAIQYLTALQRYILYGVYFENKTFRQLAKEVWLPADECEQEHSLAIAAIRRRINQKRG